jgi:hypothetical protein
MLVFGARELWWTCESAVNFDTLATKTREHIPSVQRKDGADRFSLDYWRSIVRDYTQKFLSFPNDKLSAIAGIAQLYAQFFNSRYLVGMWEFAFLSELMWCSNRSDITRPLAQRAPSWSWASIDGEIHHKWCPVELGPNAPEVLECHISPVSQSSPFGTIETTRCILRLKGLLIKAFWNENRQYVAKVSRKSLERENGTLTAPYKTVGLTHADAADENTEEVWVFPIMRTPVRGLLLAHVHDDVYRRVGLVLRMWDETLLSADCEPQTFTII